MDSFRLGGYTEEPGSIDELRKLARRQPIRGMNNEPFRQYLVYRLFRHFECSSFIETGTFLGRTTQFAAKVLGAKQVHTCELNPQHYRISRVALAFCPQVNGHLCSSPEFLRGLDAERDGGPIPFIYLDAHWYEYLPLKDELRIVAGKWRRAVIAIDDFANPLHPSMTFDECKGEVINEKMAVSALSEVRSDYRIFYPNYTPSDLGWEKWPQGIAFILLGDLPPPPNQFPFTLLAESTKSGRAPHGYPPTCASATSEQT